MARNAVNPRVLYRCPYCNNDLRLAEEGAVVDSYMNVCHLACFDKEVSHLLREPEPAPEPQAGSEPRCAHPECGKPKSEHKPFFRKDATKPLQIEPSGWFCPMPSSSSSAIWVFKPAEAAPAEPPAPPRIIVNDRVRLYADPNNPEAYSTEPPFKKAEPEPPVDDCVCTHGYFDHYYKISEMKRTYCVKCSCGIYLAANEAAKIAARHIPPIFWREISQSPARAISVLRAIEAALVRHSSPSPALGVLPSSEELARKMWEIGIAELIKVFGRGRVGPEVWEDLDQDVKFTMLRRAKVAFEALAALGQQEGKS